MKRKTYLRLLAAWSIAWSVHSAAWIAVFATRPDLDLMSIAIQTTAIAIHMVVLTLTLRDLARNRRALARADASLFAWAAVLFDRMEPDHPRRHLGRHALAGAQRASAKTIRCERLA